MDQGLQRQIQEAAVRGEVRLYRRSYRQRYPQTWSPEDLADHGPRTIARMLMETIQQLSTAPRMAPSNHEKVEYWRTFLSSYMPINTMHRGRPPDAADASRKLSDLLEHTLRPNMRTWKGVGLSLLGTCFRHTELRKFGYHQPWAVAGFYEAYQCFVKPYPDPSATEHNAAIICARITAYSIVTLEDPFVLDDLAHLKKAIQAMASGTVPIAYRQETQTLYVCPWEKL